MTTNYINLKDTNVLIRAALKEKFPGTKFSVVGDSYSGGSSTRVKWTDGPSVKAVKEVTDQFEGASFDGMIDLKSYKTAMVDGEPTHYGTDYIFENRDISEGIKAEATKFVKDAVAAEGNDPETHNYVSTPQAVYAARPEGAHCPFETGVYNMIEMVSNWMADEAFVAETAVPA